MPVPPSGYEVAAGFVRNASTGGLLVDSTQEAGATQNVAVTAQSAGLALDGSDGSGITAPAGGGGIRGWLSGIYKAVTGTLKVDGSGVTQPVSAASLPLPSGAAQDATLTGGAARTQVTNFPWSQTVAGGLSDGTLLTADAPVRRLLEQVLMEVRIQNEQLALLTGRGQLEYPENQRGL